MRFAFVVTALILVPTSLAFPPPQAPVVDGASFTQAGVARAWRISMPAGSFMSVWMLASHEDLTFGSFALWFVRADTLEFSGLVNPAWYPEGGLQAHAQTQFLGTRGTLASEVSGNYTWPLEMRVDFEPNAAGAGEWIVVALGAFDGSVVGEMRLYADDGATLVSSTSASPFLFTESDFRGWANVVAREEAPVRDAVVEAKAQAMLTVRKWVQASMFASFWGGDHLGQQHIAVDTPDQGTEYGESYYLLAARGAGAYDFRIDQNVDYHDNQPTCRALLGERCWRTPAFALGADIAIP